MRFTTFSLHIVDLFWRIVFFLFLSVLCTFVILVLRSLVGLGTVVDFGFLLWCMVLRPGGICLQLLRFSFAFIFLRQRICQLFDVCNVGLKKKIATTLRSTTIWMPCIPMHSHFLCNIGLKKKSLQFCYLPHFYAMYTYAFASYDNFGITILWWSEIIFIVMVAFLKKNCTHAL